MKVVVIGGGWSGLAAAVELAKNNVDVQLLESARQVGGRARAIKFGQFHVDNGQHILLGAYSSILQLLETIGIREEALFRRESLYLRLHRERGVSVNLQAPSWLPAPLHLLIALLSFRGIRLGQRLSLLRPLVNMKLKGFRVDETLSVADYLHHHGQGKTAVSCLWEPLCLSALNTPAEKSSMQLFVNVLRDAFFGQRKDSNLLLPIKDMGDCLPEPAMDYIEAAGGSVHLGSRVMELNIHGGAITGATTRAGSFAADHVVLATGPTAAHSLLSQHSSLDPISQNINQLRHSPITTIYFRYPAPVKLEKDFIGFVGTTVQWLFDRGRLTGDEGLMSAVISGPGPHMNWDNSVLINHVSQEIAQYYPDWPEPVDAKVIKEKRATFLATPESLQHRPHHATPIEGLWLAGDYTASDYPSTLEGAVRSGITCAKAILRHRKTSISN